MSLRDEVAKRVRVKLARAPRPSPLDAPVTADSFGGTRAMRSVYGIYSSEAPSRDPYMPGPHPFHTQPLLGHMENGDAIPREQVLNRPETVHFVAFHPRQVSPILHSYNDYAGGYDQRVAFIRQTHPEQRVPIVNETLINGKGDEEPVFRQIEQGQQRVRALLGLPNDRPGMALPVYFKSHRAAELMARAAGGRVETVAYDPSRLSAGITNNSTGRVHDVRRTPARIGELASASPRPGQEEYADYRYDNLSPQILASHPAFGEYFTTVGTSRRIPDHGESRWGFLEAQLSHRGAEAWKAGLNYRNVLNDFAQGQPHDPATGELVNHDEISRLGSTARELYERFAADPHDHLARAVLADHLEEAGQHELSDVFRASLPQQFSRRGEKTRLAKAVADRVRVKLARQPAPPVTAESFGSLGNMSRVANQHLHERKSSFLPFIAPDQATGSWRTQSADSVRNSPAALHFVAHNPLQLVPQEEGALLHNPAVRTLEHGQYRADGNGLEEPSESAPLGRPFDPSPRQVIREGQGRVRRLLGYPARDDGDEPTVYFKSHRAAKIAALLTGGHVESVSFSPKSVAHSTRRSASTGAYHIGYAPFFDIRGGQQPEALLQSLAPADDPWNDTAANVIASHPVFGEHITKIGSRNVALTHARDYSWMDPSNTHRGVALHQNNWRVPADIARDYGDPPAHFDPSVLSGVGKEIHAQFVANPGDHLARAVLADQLEEAGHHDFADAFRSTLPQQFSRRGEKLRYAASGSASGANGYFISHTPAIIAPLSQHDGTRSFGRPGMRAISFGGGALAVRPSWSRVEGGRPGTLNGTSEHVITDEMYHDDSQFKTTPHESRDSFISDENIEKYVHGQRAVRDALGLPNAPYHWAVLTNRAEAERVAQSTGGLVHGIELSPSRAKKAGPFHVLKTPGGSVVLGYAHAQNLGVLGRSATYDSIRNHLNFANATNSPKAALSSLRALNQQHWPFLIAHAEEMQTLPGAPHPHHQFLGPKLQKYPQLLAPSHQEMLGAGEPASTIYQMALQHKNEPVHRMALADTLDEQGRSDAADFFRSTIPDSEPRKLGAVGDKLRLNAAVAERVRVKLAKKASQPMTADSFGSTWHMQRANGNHRVYRGPGEIDVFLDDKGSVESADSVRSSPHAVHYVAHHPDQLSSQSFDHGDNTRGVFLHSSGSLRFSPTTDNISVPDDDPVGYPADREVHRAIDDGQRRVRQLLGIQGDLPGRSPPVYFKSHRAAQLAAAATGGRVETLAISPNRIATGLANTTKYGAPSVAHNGYEGIFDLRSGPSQDSEHARLLQPRMDGEGFSFAPHVIARHPVLGEYITPVGPRPIRNSPSFVEDYSSHRRVMLRASNWQPNAEVRQAYGYPPRLAQVAPEEAAELVREHWALLMEHASHGHQIELGGMHVPTRQHIESLGPDAQHLFALQREPAARLALSDMLEDAGHDEAAHFMRATVPVQYARNEHDAAPSSLHRVVAQYASQKLRYARGANPYRDGDRVDVVGIGAGNYRRESLSQPGMHEVDIFERGHMTHRATVSLDRITPKTGGASGAAQPATTGPQPFSEPHDLRAGDVIRIFNADDGSPIPHAKGGGPDSHDVNGYELINQHEGDTPFADETASTLHMVRTIPLGPRNINRSPFNLGTRGRTFQVLRRSEGPRDRSYVDSYGHQFYHGDSLFVNGAGPYTVETNVIGNTPVVRARNSSGVLRVFAGRQDASGAHRIHDMHVRRLSEGQQVPPATPQDSVQQTAPLRVTARRGATVPAFGASQGPPPPTVPLEIMLHDHHSTTTGSEQANRLRAMFEAIHGSPVDDETIMHILRVPRPFAGADPHHEIFHPKNIRLRVTIGNDFVHAHVDSRLRNYSFEAGTDFSSGKVYNASQFHDGWHRDVRVPGEPVKLISTPHILQNQARAAHELGVPELRVSAGMENPLSPGGMTGGIVWPSYGYTAPLASKYASKAAKLDEATAIIKRNDPSRAHDSDFWLHDLLSSQEGRDWYTKAEPTQNRTYYPNVISGSMHFRTHPDSESHQLLSAHTAKVESNAARKTTPAPEA